MASGESQRSLEAWSRAHAAGVLCAALAGALLGSPWPLVAEAALAFAYLVWSERRRATPSGRFGAANTVTSLRLLLVLLLAVRGASFGSALAGLLVLAIFTLDGLDGWLAQRRGEASAFGAHFDMETDALLVWVSSWLLFRTGHAGAWLLLAGALRYLYVLATWLFPPPASAPSRSRFARYVFSFFVSSTIACFFLSQTLSVPLSLLATALLVVSFGRSSVAAYRG